METNQMESLNILIDRTNYINTYWNFYIIVSTFMVGMVVSDKVELSTNLRRLLTISFILFTLSNYFAIYNLNEQRDILVYNISLDLGVIADTFKPDHYLKYLFFHFILDGIVLFAINKINIKEKELIVEPKR